MLLHIGDGTGIHKFRDGRRLAPAPRKARSAKQEFPWRESPTVRRLQMCRPPGSSVRLSCLVADATGSTCVGLWPENKVVGPNRRTNRRTDRRVDNLGSLRDFGTKLRQDSPEAKATPATMKTGSLSHGCVNGGSKWGRVTFDRFRGIIRIQEVRQRIERHPFGRSLFFDGRGSDVNHLQVFKPSSVHPL